MHPQPLVVLNSAAEEAGFLARRILDFQCFEKEANNNDDDNDDDNHSERGFPEMTKRNNKKERFWIPTLHKQEVRRTEAGQEDG